MIYPLDFRPPSENGNIKNKVSVSLVQNEFTVKNNIQNIGTYKRQVKDDSSIWNRYCSNSTVHGLRYLTEPSLHANERLVWWILLPLAFIGTLYVSSLLHARYSTNILATVVETTVFPISQIPYPAVTVCNNNRVNWIRVPAAIDSFLKDASNSTIGKLRDIIVALNSFEFSSFEEFEHMIDIDFTDLNHINMTDLYLSVIHSCEEIFIEPCWWRNVYTNCCGDNALFVLQKSEYGICYAFNSVMNPHGSVRYQTQPDYPWRTTKFGDWSGLRANIKINDSTKIPHIKRRSGILVMVHHPLTWPINSKFVPSGTSASVKLKPIQTYASLGVLKLHPKERNCVMMEEVEKYNYQTLPNTQYFQNNCICNCRMQYMVSTCNCTIDFIYPVGNNPQCNMSDIKCLFSNNDLYNHEKPIPGNQYFSDNQKGMVCDCLPECDSIDYSVDVTSLTGSDHELDTRIVMDVHFQKSTLFKYRTDVVFGWLDLMVGFGGIAGLFLGCSMISLAEVVFFFIIGLMKIMLQLKAFNRKIRK